MISRITRSSPIRCRRNLTIHSWLTVVEKSSDIGLDHKVDLFLLERPAKRIQALVLAAPGAVPIAAVLEYGLVDRSSERFVASSTILSSSTLIPSGLPFSLPGFGM